MATELPPKKGVAYTTIVVLLVLVAIVVCAPTVTSEALVPATEPDTTRWFLPLIVNSLDSRKGVAGVMADTMNLTDVSATWHHHWSPCWPPNYRCVDMFKLIDPNVAWLTEQAVIDTAEDCASGYIGFGDEWVLQGKSWDYQLEQTHRFIELARGANPNCRIIFGGVLTWHPDTGDAGLDWIGDFRSLYVTRYGEPPDVDGLMFDAYHWGTRDLAGQVIAADSLVRQHYGQDVELWLRETGSLASTWRAKQAVDRLATVEHLLDRWAFFVTHDDGQFAPFSLWDASGALTSLGEKYRDTR